MSPDKTLTPEYTHQIVDSSIICIFNEKFIIVYSNKNFDTLTGYHNSELIGKSLLQLKHEDQASTVYEFMIETMRCGDTWKGELQIIHKNNQMLCLDTTIKPIINNSSKKQYIAIFLNISERKQLITNLKQRAHEQSLISILGQISLNNIPVRDLLEQTLSVACGSLDVETGMIFKLIDNTNNALLYTGYNTLNTTSNSKTIEVSSLLEYLSSNDTLVISTSLHNENRFKIPDLCFIDKCEHAAFILIGDKKNPFGIFSLLSKKTYDINIYRDNFLHSVCNILSEAINRQKMEQYLRYEKELSRKYLDVAEVIIIALDKTEHVILANQKAVSTLGYSEAELTEFNFFDVFIPQDIRGEIKHIFHKTLKNGKTHDKDLLKSKSNIIPMINRMKQTRIIKWKSSLLYDNHGNITSILSAGEDITELLAYEEKQKRLENQLHQAQKMEAIGMLAGGIAHDFNNILSSILGFSDLIIENLKADDKKLHEYVNYIQESGIKAKDIIAQLQSINLQHDTPDETSLLPELLKGTLKMLRSALPADVNVNCHINENLPAVYMDAAKLNQVILQLLLNARNALPLNGEIKIELYTENIKNDCCIFCGNKINGNYVVLGIHDNGPGIDSHTLSNIFKKNSSAPPPSGLNIVAGIVHDSHGHILINPASKTTHGTNVRLLFSTLSTKSTHNKHLMIVDDENSVATYLGELFKGCGFKVSVFCDSVDALASFNANPDTYDLVITDQDMPAINGNVLAEKMLQIIPELPIILCTGHSESFDKKQAHNLNIRAFLRKPLDSEKLLHLVTTLLTKS